MQEYFILTVCSNIHFLHAQLKEIKYFIAVPSTKPDAVVAIRANTNPGCDVARELLCWVFSSCKYDGSLNNIWMH